MVAELLEDQELAEFNLSSVQREIYYDDRPTLVFVSTRGGGKTTAMVLRLHGMVTRGEIRGGERMMICGPDYTQLMDGTVKTFDYWFGDIFGLIIHKVNGNKPSRIVRAADGGEIEVLCRSGMNPDQTRSKECRAVLLDEVAQMDMEMLELASMNLRPTGLRPKNDTRVFQLLMSTTPRGMNWFYRRYGKYVLDRANDDPDIGAWHMTILEAHRQGVVTDEYLERAMQTYPPGSTKWKQEAEGEFVSWSGLVYRQDYGIIGPTNPLPDLVYTCGAIDVGSITPSAILVGGISERGGIYIFKEYYQPRALLSDLCRIAGEWTREYHIRSWDVDNDLLWKMMRNSGMSAYPPNKTKDAAGFMVEYINDLTARGMYNIDPECKGLISEKARYEYKDKTSGDEVTFLDTVKPNQDDHCLVAGTPVLTRNGDRWIERIREGEEVLTRSGWRRVIRSRMTNPAADVFDLKMSNDEVLRGTGDHPIWVQDRGWVRLDSVRYGDILLSCPEQNQSSSMASSSTATRIRRDGRIVSTSRRALAIASVVWGDFMRKSGRSGTASRFLKAITSIMPTSTGPTTVREISFVSARRSTAPLMRIDGVQVSTPTNGSPTWSVYGPSRKPGTPRWRAAHGTPTMPAQPLVTVSHENFPAIIAGRHINLAGSVAVDSAQTTVAQRTAAPAAWTMNNGLAACVTAPSPLIVTASNDSVPVSVVSVRAVPGKHAVYNLSVEDAPEFFACGVLVHNSLDTERYLVKRLASAAAANEEPCPVGTMKWSRG